MIDLNLILKSTGISVLSAVAGVSIYGINLTWLIPLVIASGGVVFSFGKLYQEVKDIKDDVKDIKKAIFYDKEKMDTKNKY